MAGPIVAFDDRFTVYAEMRSHFAGEALPKRAVPAPTPTPTAIEDTVVLALTRIKQVEHDLVEADLATLRQRLANLTNRST